MQASVENARGRVEKAARVYGRYEKFYKKLLDMQLQLNERLDVLRQYELALDFKKEYVTLGTFFQAKQLKLNGMMVQLETFLRDGVTADEEIDA